MRITKKMLRELKENLSKRVKKLLLMSKDEVRSEHYSCYPHRQVDRRGMVEQQRRELIMDAIEGHIPQHLID